MLFGIEFCTKKSEGHMSISPQIGARGLDRYPSLKYNVEKRKSRFTLGINVAENKHRIQKKGSNKRCVELNFVQKSLRTHMSISPQSGARGLERYLYYNVEKWKSRFTLGFDTVKNTHCIASKKGSNKDSELNFV